MAHHEKQCIEFRIKDRLAWRPLSREQAFRTPSFVPVLIYLNGGPGRQAEILPIGITCRPICENPALKPSGTTLSPDGFEPLHQEGWPPQGR
eukprot:2185757-Amphidinium_carterae.1